MPNLIVISSIISLYLCGFICKRWVWEIGEESSVKEELVQFATSSREEYPAKGHVWSTWLETEESCQVVKFVSTSRERSSLKVPAKLSVWQKEKVLYQILYSHYIYPYYPQNVKNVFQRENPSKNTWELEIIIPIIIYTFSLGFPLLLPLHLYILERF